MKKSYLLLASCTFLSANAFGISSHVNPSLVTIPTFDSRYEISASFLLLQPTSSSLDYGIHTQPLPAVTPKWLIQSINPDYTAAFDVGLGYVFPQSANDIQLLWAHLSQSKSDGVIAPTNDFIGPFYEIGPNAQNMQNLEGDSQFKYNLINLDVGQFVNFGCRLRTRMFTGISSVFINQHLNSSYSGVAANPLFNLSTDNISKYSGVGPRFGLLSTYQFTPRFGLVAQIAGSAYMGRLRSTMEILGSSAVLTGLGIPLNSQSIKTGSANRVVPGADGKLGLNYSFAFNHDSLLKVEAGYQFATYFNAIKEVYPSTLAQLGPFITPIQAGSIYVGTMGQSQSNFGVGGPYLKASFSF